MARSARSVSSMVAGMMTLGKSYSHFRPLPFA